MTERGRGPFRDLRPHGADHRLGGGVRDGPPGIRRHGHLVASAGRPDDRSGRARPVDGPFLPDAARSRVALPRLARGTLPVPRVRHRRPRRTQSGDGRPGARDLSLRLVLRAGTAVAARVCHSAGGNHIRGVLGGPAPYLHPAVDCGGRLAFVARAIRAAPGSVLVYPGHGRVGKPAWRVRCGPTSPSSRGRRRTLRPCSPGSVVAARKARRRGDAGDPLRVGRSGPGMPRGRLAEPEGLCAASIAARRLLDRAVEQTSCGGPL